MDAIQPVSTVPASSSSSSKSTTLTLPPPATTTSSFTTAFGAGGSGSSARLTRVLCAVLAALTALCQQPRARKVLLDNFALVPAATLGQSRVWNVATSGLVDPRAASALLHLPALAASAGRLERAWGGRALAGLLAGAGAAAGVVTYAVMLVLYIATRRTPLYFDPVASHGALVAPALVALAWLAHAHEQHPFAFAHGGGEEEEPAVVLPQLVPQRVAQAGVPVPNVPVVLLPLAHAALTVACAAAGLLPVGNAVLVVAAVHTAWLYLAIRHSRQQLQGGLPYHALYPAPLQPAARVVATALHAVVASAARATTITTTVAGATSGNAATAGATEAQHRGANGAGGMPEPDTKASAMDTERRRQRALKVLEERLNANGAAGATAAGDGGVLDSAA